ncbi:MAG: sulfite exporter TauE/SafE family protein [Anaerolineales bacterium]|nr:sulfite exporter TauE/SafE family protein [Anaerolineales bacterium]
MTALLIPLIVFCAVFTQSLTGFGVALVSMPLLVSVLDLQTAAPLVALIGLATEIILVLRYRLDVNRRRVIRLLLPSLIGVPIGVFALREVGEAVLIPLLGVLILVYALYALWNPQLPSPSGKGWAYGAGFIGGLFGGAYNTSGPPVIVYADSQKWPRAEFKGNLQGYFLFTTLFIVGGHLLAQNYNQAILREFLISLPGLLLGVAAGLWLDGRINAVVFRRLVLILLVILGVRFVVPF